MGYNYTGRLLLVLFTWAVWVVQVVGRVAETGNVQYHSTGSLPVPVRHVPQVSRELYLQLVVGARASVKISLRHKLNQCQTVKLISELH